MKRHELIAARDVAGPPLDLDEFIVEMAGRRNVQLTCDELIDLARQLHLSDELVRRHICFSAEGFARNLICRTPAFELLVLCWHPGQGTNPHDHDGALNVTRVHQGILTSRIYEVDAERPARLISEEALVPGAMTFVDRGEVHQLVNASEEDLITVHLYAPPLRHVVVYSSERPGSERVPLRYKLGEDIS